MEIHYTASVFSVAQSGDAMFMITIPQDQKSLYDKIRAYEDDKPKVMTIDYYKEKRSLTANSYMFALIGKIAKKMNLSVGDCYVKFIKDYGVSISGGYMTKEAFDVFEPTYSKVSTKLEHNSSMCTVIREFTKGETEWIEYIAFIGSSEYDKKQFSHLVNGVVQEAADLGIQTMTPQEIQSLIDKMEEI